MNCSSKSLISNHYCLATTPRCRRRYHPPLCPRRNRRLNRETRNRRPTRPLLRVTSRRSYARRRHTKVVRVSRNSQSVRYKRCSSDPQSTNFPTYSIIVMTCSSVSLYALRICAFFVVFDVSVRSDLNEQINVFKYVPINNSIHLFNVAALQANKVV